MKFKDIEKNLKREHDRSAVPNVYATAKKAPLNKLLTGETPARAFQKQLAMRLLTFVLLLFLTMAISVSAMWFTSQRETAKPDCYVSVNIEGEDGNTRLGMVVRGDYTIVYIVVEMSGGEIQTSPIVSHSSQISGFINAKNGDKVSIYALADSNMRASEISKRVSANLETLYAGMDYTLGTYINTMSAKRNWVQYINTCGGNVSGNESVATLIDVFTKLF